jgi:hypothetical protein
MKRQMSADNSLLPLKVDSHTGTEHASARL